MNNPAVLRVGLVGGGIGRSHAEAYLHLPGQFQLAADYDQAPERAEALAALAPGVRAFAVGV
jgi:predicted dehydrogenase